jgi:acetyl-CoA acetyltransferase
MARFRIDPSRVNVLGGALALGQPGGAAGTRMLVSLVHGLRQDGLHHGVLVLDGGQGQGTALIVETPC